MKVNRTRKGQKSSKKDTCFYIEGLSALSEFARYRPEAIKRVIAKHSIFSDVRSLLPKSVILEQFEDLVKKEDLPSRSPVIAWVEIKPLSYKEMLQKKSKILLPEQKDFILILDHISDPRNLGAVARSAAFFGLKEIVVPKCRQVLLTPSSVGTSQGAFSLIDLVVVSNIANVISNLKKDGYWVIYADKKGESLSEIVRRKYSKIVLILGAEDKGVSELIKKKSDICVGIQGSQRSLDSLNVSVAAGVLLHSFLF